jgi:P27 family predicted phage terminase small subunit
MAAQIVPDAPEQLGDAGREAWAAAWAVEWTADPDTGTITHLCRLEDEAANIVEVIERDGYCRLEPIVSPRGHVVGERWASHPLLGDLRKLDAQLVALRDRLGLDPASRARIGLDAAERRADALDLLGQRRQERLAKVAKQREAS